MNIHHTAIIDTTASLGNRVSIGPFSLVGPKVVIGDQTKIGSQVTIESGTVLGNNCQIFHGASLGGEPQILGFDSNISSSVVIGDNTIIREYVTIHRSNEENGVTTVGDHCLLMAYTHVAHDCKIGNNVVLVNYTGLPGHIVIEDKAFISGLVGIHQFARIGKYAMVGGMAAVRKDVLPFSLVEGYPARLIGPNTIGLRRGGIAPKIRTALKKAFVILKDSELNTTQALDKITKEIEIEKEIRYLTNFIKSSSRGITK